MQLVLLLIAPTLIGEKTCIDAPAFRQALVHPLQHRDLQCAGDGVEKHHPYTRRNPVAIEKHKLGREVAEQRRVVPISFVRKLSDCADRDRVAIHADSRPLSLGRRVEQEATLAGPSFQNPRPLRQSLE